MAPAGRWKSSSSPGADRVACARSAGRSSGLGGASPSAAWSQGGKPPSSGDQRGCNMVQATNMGLLIVSWVESLLINMGEKPPTWCLTWFKQYQIYQQTEIQ